MQNPVITYLKNDNIYNTQNLLPSYQQIGQSQEEYLTNQRLYNPNQMYFQVPKPNNQNQYPVQGKHFNFENSSNYYNYSSNTLSINLANNFDLENKRWIQSTNKDDSTINKLSR